MSLIAREEEVRVLENLYQSNQPEFLALYGRRRVGKTYLIRTFFAEKEGIFFNVTGTKDGPMKEQIANFTDQLGQVFYGGVKLEAKKNWRDAFDLLTTVLKTHVKDDKPIVLFFDELPWMAGRNSRLLQALDYYWNQHWSGDPRIKLIICGSSASWMINKIINNRGGLHNRVTKRICLEPFNLAQTKQFLDAAGVQLNQRQILLLYMVMGGVPYYLSQVEKGLSTAQVIERLAFSKKSFLMDEFDNLFSSLFDDCETHISVVKLLAQHPYGLGERKLLEKVGRHTIGGTGRNKLKALEETGFIMRFTPLFHRKKGVYYRLTDEYTLFYLKWIEPLKGALKMDSLDHEHWQAMQLTPEWYSWLGYAFESVCYKHISKIRKALKLPAMSLAGTWRYVPKKGAHEEGAQIDLLFDRQDDAITVCEIKFSDEPFVLTKGYVEALRRKVRVLQVQTRTKKQIFIAMIASAGLKNNFYAEDFISETAMIEDLF